ncbi:MAG: helix-turn-helix transcriptional regulator [Rhodospirillaceae bacterium]|nr:helix-turn-helix transcriptional regulator [Rhodospirillales bacterium]
MIETIGSRLRSVRGKMSQDEFAGHLSVHKETVGKYERNLMQPGSDVLVRLHQNWRVDINWLLTGEGDTNVPAGTSGDLNEAALTAALRAVEELLDQRHMVLTYEKKTKLIAMVYKQLMRSDSGQSMELGMLNDLLDLAS